MLKTPISVLLMAILLLLSFPIGRVAAQEQEPEQQPAEEPFIVYTLGQNTLSLSVGMFIPLFFQSFGGGYERTNLKLSGAGSIQWGIHLNNHWMVGLEVAGMLSRDINDVRFFMLPITAKGSYILHLFPFEFPIFIGTGMNIIKWSDELNISWIIKPGFSTIWKYNVNWGFGLNVVYWWVPQFWPDDRELGRMGNFLELTLTAQYNF